MEATAAALISGPGSAMPRTRSLAFPAAWTVFEAPEGVALKITCQFDPTVACRGRDQYDDDCSLVMVWSDMASTKFVLRGREFAKEQSDFVNAARRIEPGRIQKYSTFIGGERYPIRQVVAAATGLRPIEITSQDAYRILDKFGFRICVDQ